MLLEWYLERRTTARERLYKEVKNTSFDLATNLTPIIQGVIDILPLFLDLVIAMVPIVITLAVVGFLLGFFDKILGMIRL